MRIQTSDKDFYQLVDGRTRLLPAADPGKEIGAEEVISKTGVPPGKIVQWLALTGDASDNIPGVPGIGAKTAAKLLNEHGSLEGLWESLDRIGPARIKEALATHRDVVERNVEMIRLRDNLPVPLDWDATIARPEEPDRLMSFFERMEFHSFARELRERNLFQDVDRIGR